MIVPDNEYGECERQEIVLSCRDQLYAAAKKFQGTISGTTHTRDHNCNVSSLRMNLVYCLHIKKLAKNQGF